MEGVFLSQLHGTIRTSQKTSSTKILLEHTLKLFDSIIDKNLLIRRINISYGSLSRNDKENTYEQFSLFSDSDSKESKESLKKEDKIQKAMISIKQKYGKNAILKGTDLQEGATTMQRNNEIGGHKA